MMANKCRAKSKQTGNRCGAYEVEKTGLCHYHGGRTPKGIAAPTWKTGKYSKHMPERLGTLAIEAATDPELLNLTELIGVYQARLQHLLELVGTGASPERFHAIRETVYALGSATNKGQVNQHMDALLGLVRDLEHDWLLWKDIDVAAQNFKKLIESERKRRIEMHALIPTQKATAFAREVALAVRAEVSDPVVLARIGARLEDILGAHPQVVRSEDQDG